MIEKALISELTWRSLQMQKAAFPDMPHYVAPDEIGEMLRPTTRKAMLRVNVISYGVIANSLDGLKKFINLCKTRKNVEVVEHNSNFSWHSSQSAASLIDAWVIARKQGASRRGGEKTAERFRAESEAKINIIRDRWPLPSKDHPTKALLKEADVSINTAKKFLGNRTLAQYNYQAKLKRKARRAG